MSTHPQGAPRPLPARANLRHLKDQAKDLLEAGAAQSITDAQFQIARLYGFASWPKLKAHVDSFAEIGKLKQAIDTNDIVRVKTMMARNPALHRAPLGYGKDGPLTWVAECRVPWESPRPVARPSTTRQRCCDCCAAGSIVWLSRLTLIPHSSIRVSLNSIAA